VKINQLMFVCVCVCVYVYEAYKVIGDNGESKNTSCAERLEIRE